MNTSMGQWSYSQDTGGFYCSGFHGDNIPKDAINISEARRLELLDGLSSGMHIVLVGGELVLKPVPPPSNEQLAKIAQTKRDSFLRDAAFRLAPLQDAQDLNTATAAELTLLKKWQEYRVALSRIEEQADFPSAITWPPLPTNVEA